MPDRMHMMDTGYPNFTGMETTEDKVTAIQNYLFMFMEELRYLLRHLDADNFTDAGLAGMAESMVETMASNILNNAELAYDRLSTSRRIRKYLLGDTSDDNFIRIRDQYQQFITGTIQSATTLDAEAGVPLLTESGIPLTLELGQAATEQACNRYGQRLYWQREPAGCTEEGYPLDGEGDLVYATVSPSAWPVTVYQYTELTKAQIAFERGGARDQYLPQIIMGAGDENGNSKGCIFKDELGFYLRYISSLAKNVDIVFSDEGFVDAMHRRLSSVSIDGETGNVLYTVEGSEDIHSLQLRESEGTITCTWPDGHVCTITVTGGSE